MDGSRWLALGKYAPPKKIKNKFKKKKKNIYIVFKNKIIIIKQIQK